MMFGCLTTRKRVGKRERGGGKVGGPEDVTVCDYAPLHNRDTATYTVDCPLYILIFNR